MKYEPDIRFSVYYNFKTDGFHEFKVFSTFNNKFFVKELAHEGKVCKLDCPEEYCIFCEDSIACCYSWILCILPYTLT